MSTGKEGAWRALMSAGGSSQLSPPGPLCWALGTEGGPVNSKEVTFQGEAADFTNQGHGSLGRCSAHPYDHPPCAPWETEVLHCLVTRPREQRWGGVSWHSHGLTGWAGMPSTVPLPQLREERRSEGASGGEC